MRSSPAVFFALTLRGDRLAQRRASMWAERPPSPNGTKQKYLHHDKRTMLVQARYHSRVSRMADGDATGVAAANPKPQNNFTSQSSGACPLIG
jgi:hypothetical protein